MSVRDSLYEEELQAYRKGLHAEKRFQQILLRLTAEHVWIHRVDLSSDKDDLLGIDFFVTITDESRTTIRIPVQVKSSVEHLKRYLSKHQGTWRGNLFTIVIHEGKSDEDVTHEILNGLTYVRDNHVNYSDVFAALRHTKVHEKSLEQYQGTLMSICRHVCLSQITTLQ